MNSLLADAFVAGQRPAVVDAALALLEPLSEQALCGLAMSAASPEIPDSELAAGSRELLYGVRPDMPIDDKREIVSQLMARQHHHVHSLMMASSAVYDFVLAWCWYTGKAFPFLRLQDLVLGAFVSDGSLRHEMTNMGAIMHFVPAAEEGKRASVYAALDYGVIVGTYAYLPHMRPACKRALHQRLFSILDEPGELLFCTVIALAKCATINVVGLACDMFKAMDGMGSAAAVSAVVDMLVVAFESRGRTTPELFDPKCLSSCAPSELAHIVRGILRAAADVPQYYDILGNIEQTMDKVHENAGTICSVAYQHETHGEFVMTTSAIQAAALGPKQFTSYLLDKLNQNASFLFSGDCRFALITSSPSTLHVYIRMIAMCRPMLLRELLVTSLVKECLEHKAVFGEVVYQWSNCVITDDFVVYLASHCRELAVEPVLNMPSVVHDVLQYMASRMHDQGALVKELYRRIISFDPAIQYTQASMVFRDYNM